MQIMFGTILCVLLKGLILTRATITPKDDNTSNILQEESISMHPDLNFMQDISMSEKSDHHILNFKSDRSHSDNTVRNEQEYDEDIFFYSFIEGIIKNRLKPTSFRAFVQFDSQFTDKVNDIFVTLRWNRPESISEYETIYGYTMQCYFIEDLKQIQICDKNITTLEHTVHNLKPNTTYYFRVRAYTQIIAGPYSDLINVSTTHENPIPKLLLVTDYGIHVLDLDSNTINNLVKQLAIKYVAYSAQEHKIYWTVGNDLMTLKITENNNITKIASFDHMLRNLCIDWVARNLYWIYSDLDYSYIVKFDLTMWENGIIKYDKIFIERHGFYVSQHLFVSSMGILYYKIHWENQYNIMKYHFDRKNMQIVQMNSSTCQIRKDFLPFVQQIIIDDMNNEEPLIYLINNHNIIVTNTNLSTCNTFLHNNDMFKSMTIDKTNTYILAYNFSQNTYHIYVSKKKHVSLNSVNIYEYEKIISPKGYDYISINSIYSFDKYSQPYPPIRCLTPDEKIYNFENVTATANSIIVNLSEPVVKSGCKIYNLPTTIYTIFISCLDNNLNKSEKFKTYERYYEIQNLTPFTEYKLQFTLSNFYYDQLSINPVKSNVTLIKTNSGKLNAPENISVLALTPAIAVVHWMRPKKMNCVAMTYEVHWKLVNDTQQESNQSINLPKRMADGRFFTKINLSLPVQDYLIHVRVYPFNVSDFYNESLNKIVDRYSEPNNITLSKVDINSMDISWISNVNLTIFPTLEYKEIATKKWQATNYKKNYSNEIIYHMEDLQPGTSYNFRLILRYPEYEENFTWPADKRFIFSTLGSKRDMLDIPEIIADSFLEKYYLLLLLGFIVIICYIYYLYHQCRDNTEQFPSTMTDIELKILPDECAITKIARKQIIFTEVIGSGAFGKVYQGKVKNLEGSDTEISVALKTLRKDAFPHEKKRLLKEAELMNHFRHKHILRLLGITLDGISPFLVLELMETGDLLKYLRDCRNLEASDSQALRLHDLFAMCEDVARGCCYLEELRFVHRDLACRNCLVSSRNREDRVIKIADFGLARDIYMDDYYRVEGENSLPVRWMAPESLMIRRFTSQSDVWSFGVLMWEITSLGEQPYAAKTNEEVKSYVLGGGRLPETVNCPSALHQLMQSCWSSAAARPNFEFCLKNIITLRENIEDTLLSPVDTF